MGLVPMQFGAADFTVGKPDLCHPFQFPPTTPAKSGLEPLPLADGEINGHDLDVSDVTEKLEIHLHEISIATGELRCNG